MKICHIGNINCIHLQNIINYFQNEGHKNMLLSLSRPLSLDRRESLNDDVRVQYVGPCNGKRYYSPIFWLSRYAAARRVRQFVREYAPDILHAYYVTDSGLLGTYSGFHPFVIFAIGSDGLIDMKKNHLKSRAIQHSINSADRVLCYSKELRDALCTNEQVTSKTRYICNGVDCGSFKKTAPDTDLMTSLRLDKKHKIIISLRNFAPVYNVDCLIKSVPDVVRALPDVRFLIIGEGELEQELKDLAKRLDVSDYIRFHPVIPNVHLTKYINLATVYVSTSISDGMSFSLLEAMACEKPVIATAIPANEQIIEHDINGLLFEKGSPVDLGEKLIALLRNDKTHAKMGKQNRKRVMERHNFSDFMENVSESFRQLI
jgi:glycosyltransferase involved in cell wall biosynthesis